MLTRSMMNKTKSDCLHVADRTNKILVKQREMEHSGFFFSMKVLFWRICLYPSHFA